MQALAAKLATAALAVTICATPVSLGLVPSTSASVSATASASTRVALILNTAQARAAHEHGARQTSGRAGGREAARPDEHRSGNTARADYNRAGDRNRRPDINGANVRGNNVRVGSATVNNVNVNKVDARRINRTYVTPPYVATRAPAISAGTAAVIGTGVATSPASCTVVVYDGTTYHDCGGIYYVATDTGYVAVSAPR